METQKKRYFFLFVLLQTFQISNDCFAKELTYWNRNKGQYSDIESPKNIKKIKIHLEKNILEKELYDIQYGRSFRYRGIALGSIIADLKASNNVDMSLLHFENGMIIPVSFNRSKKLGVESFLAFSILRKGIWNSQFPMIARHHDRYRDPRPIKFNKNKLVMKSAAHPSLPLSKGLNFSPWLHMNSLLGIELVNSNAYYKQFLPANGKNLEGLKVFISRCQYCHGVRKVGAKFGWDFAGPIAIHKKRSIESLELHVAEKKHDAFEQGVRMPHQADITRKEVQALWWWARNLSEVEFLRPYDP